ncbi:uncharacterized protein LOC114298884 isoform X1 [Camellia sinensis]|uniref:uncharacterized protein LOC114298884 isoform X1 n=1 Tax=Camellia sinensis TaxID=4442 RepID=UPI0010369870|nr:uncharacterized protein LOC114298884 isoform X1 [Camellia sinensis]XP_028099337.1 uncharacterized protein LOC114298884 isoform X1 [Camellia sinensis]
MNSNSQDKNMKNDDDDDSDKRSRDNPYRPRQDKAEDMRLWGILIFGLIGATATTFAVGQLRRTVDWFYTQFSFRLIILFKLLESVILIPLHIQMILQLGLHLTRSQSSWKGSTGGSFRSSFQEEAWKRYNRRMQEEYEEEMERGERIRRMQSVFNRERNKYKRSYESWGGNAQGEYHQHFQREDWYWKTDASYRDSRTNFRETPQGTAHNPLSHHYSVLGLDRLRTKPYTDVEIKTAFRTKAKEFHPDQNQDNKELAEAKFKEVMSSYEAIKMERKNK